MHPKYTPEEVRALVAEGGVLNYEAATAAAAAEATEVLEGVEELIAKLEPAVRREALSGVALETGDELWVPVVHNCRRSCGIAVSPEGLLDFAVKGAGENLVTYFAARQAVSHALSGRAVVDGTILPHPEENGPTSPNLSVVDLDDGSEGFPEDIPDDEDFLCAPASPDERETGAVDFALKGLAGDEPSDLAAEGLGYPEGVPICYLGRQDNGGGALDVAASFVPSSACDYTPEEPELRPDWRARLEDLRGELPDDLLDDAAALLEETGEASIGSYARPAEFFAELTRRRAAASLTTEDLDAHRRAERLGALDPAPLEAGMVRRLSTAGRAHLRTISGQLLLVPVDSPAGLVAEAAERSRFARLEEQQRGRERHLFEVVAPLFEPARALSLEAVLGRLGGPAHKDFLRRLIKGGYLEVRRIEGEVILCDNGATEPVFRRAARLAKRVRSESFSNKKVAAARARERGSKAFAAPMVPYGGTKVGSGELAGVLELEEARQAARDSGRTAARVEHPGYWDCEISVGWEGAVHVLPIRRREVRVFCAPGAYHAWPVSITTVLHDPDGTFEGQLAEERAVGFDRRQQTSSEWADRLPESGRESGPSPEGAAATGRSFLDAERRGEAVIGTYGRGIPNPSRSPRQRSAARRRVGGITARAEAEARAKAHEGALARKATWEEALKVHLSSLPAAERLELFLQLGGRQEFAVLERSATDPEGLKLAVRELAEAGRIKARRSRSSGKVFLEAVEALDRLGRDALEKALLRIMARGEVEVPKGTRLARRVAATKAVLTKAAKADAALQASTAPAA